MINVFEDINKGNFTKITKAKEIMPSDKMGSLDLTTEGRHHTKFLHGQVVDLQKLPKVSAKRTNGDIMLENVSVITPSGDIVVPNLSLQVSNHLCYEVFLLYAKYSVILFD